MPAVSAPSILLSKFKNALAAQLPGLRSAHVSEAIAAGCGYKTNAALLADLKSSTSFDLIPVTALDAAAMARRLAELDPKNANGALALLVPALEHVSTRLVGRIVPIGGRTTLTVPPPAMEVDADTKRVADLFDGIIRAAAVVGDRYIHMAANDEGYRIDVRGSDSGTLRPLHQLDRMDAHRLLVHVKTAAGIDCTNGQGQTGKLHFTSPFPIDATVMTNPAARGETLSIRLKLSPKEFDLDDLGLSHEVLGTLKQSIKRPGLHLLCGPTGSGKTTVSNKLAQHLEDEGHEISYRTPAETGAIFPFVGRIARKIGSTLKRNKNDRVEVFFFGELRDEQGARQAAAIARSGAAVIATMHTGSILSAATRLRDLSMPEDDISNLVRTVMVQILLRKRCEACSGAGCRSCRDGYSGRFPVAEIAAFDPLQLDAIRSMPALPWNDMLDDALNKVDAGLTDMNAVVQAFGPEATDRLSLRENDATH